MKRVILTTVLLIVSNLTFAQSCDLAALQQANEREIMQMRRLKPNGSPCDIAQKRAAQSMQVVAMAIKCNSPDQAQAALAAKHFKQDADQFCDDTAPNVGMRQNDESEFDAGLEAAKKAARERGLKLSQERKQKEFAQQQERARIAQEDSERADRMRQQARNEEYQEVEDHSTRDAVVSLLGTVAGYQQDRANAKAAERARAAQQVPTSTYTSPSNTTSRVCDGTTNRDGCTYRPTKSNELGVPK